MYHYFEFALVSDSFIINALIANIKTCSQIYEKFPLMFRKLKQKGLNQKNKNSIQYFVTGVLHCS